MATNDKKDSELASLSTDGITTNSSDSGACARDSSYSRVKVLGRGTFGEAVLYRKSCTNELVVWKEIYLQRANETERNSALNEVEILSQLDHINVIAYYNDFFDGSSLYIEMEYANAGSLHHKIIAQNGELFEERQVLNYFYQVLSAVSYIHSYGILHRDIKALNVFVTKRDILKLGDFGVSKVLEHTYGAADTCVGTPYYMSPEVTKGESYDQKSDIWACGCLLYELLTLQKVFQSSNQLSLIVNILESEPPEPSELYSPGLRDIIKQTLQKQPADRPSAEHLCALEIFKGAKRFISEEEVSDVSLRRLPSRLRTMSQATMSDPVVSTMSSDVFCWGGGTVLPQKLSLFSTDCSGVHVAAGFSHFAVVSVEKELYTWANVQGGTQMVGQLGQGNRAMYRTPKKVPGFDGVPIKSVCCGEDFTVILTESGEVFACGSDYYGTIGCGNTMGESVVTPTKIKSLQGIFIETISCGDSHVVAVTSQGIVYSWGCGEYGRLGLGNEDDYSEPQIVGIPSVYSAICSVTCGRDNTLLLTVRGDLIAFGSNENNKMGLNQTFRAKNGKTNQNHVIHYSLLPVPVRALRSYKLISVAAGKSHSAFIDEYNRMLTIGSNDYGQLGTGDFKPREGPVMVRGDLGGKEVIKCACGSGFTVAITKDNLIYSWGRSENGRLGQQQNAGGEKNRAFPKPIFSALHRVPSISCRHWNTIILAEQVLSSKVIQTKALSLTESESGRFHENRRTRSEGGSDQQNRTPIDSVSTDSFKFVRDLQEYENCLESENCTTKSRQSNSSTGQSTSVESDVPPWLMDELNNASFIPMAKDETPDNHNITDHVTSTSFRELPPDHVTSHEEPRDVYRCRMCASRDRSYLEVRLKEVEVENFSLRKRVKEQEILIAALEKERDCYARSTDKLMQLTEGNVIGASASAMF